MKRLYWTLILAAGLLAACSGTPANRPGSDADAAAARPVAITADHVSNQAQGRPR